jgi:predicted nucleic acid-binding Zn ribbon protein
METPQQPKPEVRKVPRCVFCGKLLDEPKTFCSRRCEKLDRHPT